MATTQTRTVRITFNSLRGLQFSPSEVQIVWNAFGVTQQTVKKKMENEFDQRAGNIGVVKWNEEFALERVDLAEHDTLQMAIWEYEAAGDGQTEVEPQPLGFQTIPLAQLYVRDRGLYDIPVELGTGRSKANIIIQFALESDAFPSDGQDHGTTGSENSPSGVSQGSSAAPPRAVIVAAPSPPGSPSASSGASPTAPVREEAKPPVVEQAPPVAAPEQPEQPAEQQKEQPVEQPVEQPKEQPVEQPAEQPPVVDTAVAAQQQQEEQSPKEERLPEAAAAPAELPVPQQASPPALSAVSDVERRAPLELDVQSPARQPSTEGPTVLTSQQRSELFRKLFADVGVQDLPSDVPALGQGPAHGQSREQIIASVLALGSDVPTSGRSSEDLQDEMISWLLTIYIKQLPEHKNVRRYLTGIASKAVKELLGVPQELDAASVTELNYARECVTDVVRNYFSKSSDATLVFYLPQAYQAQPWPVVAGVEVKIVPNATEGPAAGTLDVERLGQLIATDSAEGRVPALVGVFLGYTAHSFSDDITAIAAIANEHKLALHVEGPGQLLLPLNLPGLQPLKELIEVRKGSRIDVGDGQNALVSPNTPPVTTCVVEHQLCALAGHPGPATFWVTSTHQIGLREGPLKPVVQFYTALQQTSTQSMLQQVQARASQVQRLVQALQDCRYVELVTSTENIFSVRFRFTASGDAERSVDSAKISQVTASLCREFDQHFPGTLSLHSENDSQLASHHLVLSKPLTDESIVRLADRFERGGSCLSSVVSWAGPTQQKLKAMRSVPHCVEMAADEMAAAMPQALACFRFKPELYNTEAQSNALREELNTLNDRMNAQLESFDRVFRPVQWRGDLYCAIACDEELNTIFDAESIERLLKEVMGVTRGLMGSDEVQIRLHTEVTKKGIEKAEKLLKARQQKSDQSLVRLIPIVNWFTASDDDESIRFDLASCKLVHNENE